MYWEKLRGAKEIRKQKVIENNLGKRYNDTSKEKQKGRL